MLFNSQHFLIFFPLVTLLYFAIPHKLRYLWLLACSYYFYMCWNPKYALLMLTSTAITYISGLLIDHSDKNSDGARAVRMKKLWVALSFASNLAILFFFKYFDFALENINLLFSQLGFGVITPAFDIILPVGISFYTFQALSYTMDVYRKDIYAEKNFFKYALFVSFFPQLVAGPIERSKNLLVQISVKHYFDYTRIKNGMLLMLWGFFQKLVIADRVAILVNQVYNNYSDYGSFALIFATILFAVQIYCDFSSYSDIAIGAAQVMGFSLMQNFAQPYFSTSIADFWRNWHISLSTWFRDYLYIPLGGNRKGRVRKYINLMIVFLASGLWHGASWTFVIWGFLHGTYQVLGDITKPVRARIKAFFGANESAFSSRLYKGIITFVLVDFAWIFFRANSVQEAFGIIKRIFSLFDFNEILAPRLYELGLSGANLVLTGISLLILLCISVCHKNGISLRKRLSEQGLVMRWTIYLTAIFAVLIFGIYGPGYEASQFIYFQF